MRYYIIGMVKNGTIIYTSDNINNADEIIFELK